MGQWFADWFATFDAVIEFEIEEARQLGDMVFLSATHHGRGRTSGAEVHGHTAYLYGVRDGRSSASGCFRAQTRHSPPPAPTVRSDRPGHIVGVTGPPVGRPERGGC